MKIEDKYIKDCFIKSGWYKGRRIDISHFNDILKREGYVINREAYDILTELSGLYIKNVGDEKYNVVDINFDPIYYASGEFDRLEEFEELAGEGLYPIGGTQIYILYVGTSGKVYMGIMDVFYYVGCNIEEFISNMFKKSYEPIIVRGRKSSKCNIR